MVCFKNQLFWVFCASFTITFLANLQEARAGGAGAGVSADSGSVELLPTSRKRTARKAQLDSQSYIPPHRRDRRLPNSGTIFSSNPSPDSAFRYPAYSKHLPPQSPFVVGAGKIKLMVSVDWEGRAVVSENINRIVEFRSRYPEIHLWHFLNAAYFLKPRAMPNSILQKIRKTIQSGDELGLHLHGWRLLFESAGVVFKKELHMGIEPLQCEEDCGHAVPISEYTRSDVRAVLRKSIEIQMKNGFPRPTSFRAGAWLGSPQVLEALAAEGFLVDSSSVPIQSFDQKHLGSNYPSLPWRLMNLWEEISNRAQPFLLRTARGTLVEHPDNGLLADWTTADAMYQLFVTLVEKYRKYPNQDWYLHIGFHQETASAYLERIEQAIELIREYAVLYRIPLEMARFPEDLGSFLLPDEREVSFP